MFFERQNAGQSAAERLAVLLNQEPIRVSVPQVKHRPYDFFRAFVVALLLTSVAGTWSLAFFLGQP